MLTLVSRLNWTKLQRSDVRESSGRSLLNVVLKCPPGRPRMQICKLGLQSGVAWSAVPATSCHIGIFLSGYCSCCISGWVCAVGTKCVSQAWRLGWLASWPGSL